MNLRPGETFQARYKSKMSKLFQTRAAYEKFDEALAYSLNDQLDLALESVAEAIEIVPHEARFLGLKGDIHYKKRQYPTAKLTYTRAVALDDNYFEYYLGRGLVNNKQGNFDAAVRDLNQSNNLLPTAIANHALGQLSLTSGDKNAAKKFFNKAMQADSEIGRQARYAFTHLDILDNPSDYLSLSSAITDSGHLVAEIRNSTQFTVSEINVEFSAVVNQETIRKTIRIESVAADQKLKLDSGLRFSSDDLVENPNARVFSARVGARY